MEKIEAAKELIQSIDRVFEIEAEYSFNYIFDRDWIDIDHKYMIDRPGYLEQLPKEEYGRISNAIDYIQATKETQVLNARISALACEAGLRDRGWDAEISFDSYRCEKRKHFKEYISGWAPKAKLPLFIWSVPGKLRILKEEAIMCHSKKAEADCIKNENRQQEPAGTMTNPYIQKIEAHESSLNDIATQVDSLILANNTKSLFETHIDNVFREAKKYRKYIRAEYEKARKNPKDCDCFWKYRPDEVAVEYFVNDKSAVYNDETMQVTEVLFPRPKDQKLDPLSYVYSMARGTTGKQHENLTLLDYQYFILACIHDCQRGAAGQLLIYFDPRAIALSDYEPCDFKNRICGKFYTLIYGLTDRDIVQTVLYTIQLALQAVEADCTKPAGAEQETEPICDQVFIFYSHTDKRWLDDLQTHLKPYLRNVSLTAWSDRQIAPGSKWFSQIKTALAHTKVAVLLVTPNFLASDFIHEHELTPLLKEVDKGEVRIIWIPVRACSYKQTPLKDYQAAIDSDKPLANMKAERDKAWVRICEEIQRAVAI